MASSDENYCCHSLDTVPSNPELLSDSLSFVSMEKGSQILKHNNHSFKTHVQKMSHKLLNLSNQASRTFETFRILNLLESFFAFLDTGLHDSLMLKKSYFKKNKKIVVLGSLNAGSW